MTTPTRGQAPSRPGQPTPRQAEVLSFVAAYQAKNEYPPTIVEICERFRWSSKRGAHGHLAALAKLGLVERPGKGRYGLKLTTAGKRLIEEERARVIRFAAELRKEAAHVRA